MVRGNKVNGGNITGSGDKADTLNLLDSTDSDVEWLSLPPIKGKKPKKKKSTKAHRDAGCSSLGLLRVFLTLVVVGTVVLLGILSIWLTSQVNDLKMKIDQMESKSSLSADDVEKLYEQISSISKNMDQHGKTLESVSSNISVINETVTQLSDKVRKVNEGLMAAPELKQLPEKLITVSKSLAALGSDLAGVKENWNTVSPFMKSTDEKINDLTTQMQNIINQVSSGQADPGREGSKMTLETFSQEITGQLQEINSTISAELSVLMKSNTQQEERLSQLEKTATVLTKNLSSISTDHVSISSDHETQGDYSSAKFNSSVTAIIESMLPDDAQEVMANLSSMLKEVEDKYKTTEPTVTDSDDELVTMEMFKTLGDGFEAKVESLNGSFIRLKSDVSAMSELLSKQAGTVSSLTHEVQATKAFLGTLQLSLENAGSQKQVTSAVPKVSSTVEGNQTITNTDTVTTKTPVTEKVRDTLGKPGTTTTKVGAVSVSRIKNWDDLELNFRRWDSTGSGQVAYDILPNFLGPEVPEENTLKQFDADGNGLYSLDEFANAFGFQRPTTESSTQSSTEVPR